MGENAPATVILSAPTFLFAVKLTTFNANASAPFVNNAIALPNPISLADAARTRSSSPERSATKTHCTNANGDIRESRSSGWSCSLTRVRTGSAVLIDDARWCPSDEDDDEGELPPEVPLFGGGGV